MRRFIAAARQRRLGRRAHHEAAPGALSSTPQIEAMQFGDGARDAEAKPMPRRAAGRRRAVEAAEDEVALGRGDAGAAVAHLDTGRPPISAAVTCAVPPGR